MFLTFVFYENWKIKDKIKLSIIDSFATPLLLILLLLLLLAVVELVEADEERRNVITLNKTSVQT